MVRVILAGRADAVPALLEERGSEYVEISDARVTSVRRVQAPPQQRLRTLIPRALTFILGVVVGINVAVQPVPSEAEVPAAALATEALAANCGAACAAATAPPQVARGPADGAEVLGGPSGGGLRSGALVTTASEQYRAENGGPGPATPCYLVPGASTTATEQYMSWYAPGSTVPSCP